MVNIMRYLGACSLMRSAYAGSQSNCACKHRSDDQRYGQYGCRSAGERTKIKAMTKGTTKGATKGTTKGPAQETTKMHAGPTSSSHDGAHTVVRPHPREQSTRDRPTGDPGFLAKMHS